MSVKHMQNISESLESAQETSFMSNSSCSPQIAVTLLVHKIHSPQEWEALQALTVSNAASQQANLVSSPLPAV